VEPGEPEPPPAAGAHRAQEVHQVRIGRAQAVDRVHAIGKKLTSAITITFGRRSNPVQMTTSGAIATIGTICDTTSHGYTARSNQPRGR